ncbi:MAG: protein translocase subunit SecF [Candidatus Portiera sp.]|nr:protein translocase subunit SecF [Portiera sp.]
MSIKESFAKFNFMDYGGVARIASLGLCVLALAFILLRGINWGLDFTGGTVVELGYSESVDLEEIRESLDDGGFSSAVVQYFGDSSTILIRLNTPEDVSKQVLDLVSKDGVDVDLRLAEYIGPQVGKELQEKGGLGMLLAILMVLIYVSFRFQLKYAVGAIVALVHDVLIILGFFALFQVPFDLSVLAAIMAVIGYSLNDTIVVSDRIRENLQTTNIEKLTEVINLSLRQVFGRTLITSLTTFFVLVCLFLFSGDSIRYFALALMLGVIVGTYSSIYVSSNLLIMLKLERSSDISQRLEKEGYK